MHHLRRDLGGIGAHTFGGHPVIAGQHHHSFARDGGAHLPGDPGEADGDFFQPPKAPRRLGQRLLPSERLRLGSSIQGGDGVNDGLNLTHAFTLQGNGPQHRSQHSTHRIQTYHNAAKIKDANRRSERTREHTAIDIHIQSQYAAYRAQARSRVYREAVSSLAIAHRCSLVRPTRPTSVSEASLREA